ncbi:zf-HC2 domain-containing protein [Streptomyces sp. NRRL S-920]|uniref:zf-HC2 domain-containing protein n=1 Tax=Streptomyces sp. NRRL S-920 TaxID=1463921 RepID=UPI0004C6BE3B|nr:zf-HC2 domain-containing protein [Streptomyces sp. NRRL S-920]
MRSLERHRDVGAYALGVLDEADAFRFEDHLPECAACLLALAELQDTARLLECYGRTLEDFGRAAEPPAAPGPALLDRTLRDIGRRHTVRRGGRLCAAALAVALAFATPAVTLVAVSGAGPERVSARDARSGVLATLTAHDRAWGTDLALTVRDPAPRARVCTLVAVGKDGSERTITTWKAPGKTAEIPAAAALRPGQTDRYEVRTTDGQRLVTLRL